jgi:hypothetical protein
MEAQDDDEIEGGPVGEAGGEEGEGEEKEAAGARILVEAEVGGDGEKDEEDELGVDDIGLSAEEED